MRFSKSSKTISTNLIVKGYDLIKPSFYLGGMKWDRVQLSHVFQTYADLKKDPSVGNRYRAYTRMEWDPENNVAVKAQSNDYYQSVEYNYQDGGKIRRFDEISNDFFYNPIIQRLISNDIEIAQQYPIVQFNKFLDVGLHQIRYQAAKGEASFSSPPWLHKDDEPLVFVHLLHVSKDIIGGDSLLAEKGVVTQVVQLKKPLDTLVLGKGTIHAVTPVGGKCIKKPATRDILLVTFKNSQNKNELPDSAINKPTNDRTDLNKDTSKAILIDKGTIHHQLESVGNPTLFNKNKFFTNATVEEISEKWRKKTSIAHISSSINLTLLAPTSNNNYRLNTSCDEEVTPPRNSSL